jgi:N-methylhydantoinase B
MVLANVRAKKEVGGDLRAQIAANDMGIRRLTQLMGRYGIETVKFYIDKLIEYSERLIRAELLKLPRGTFQAEEKLDDDGITSEPVHLKARITLDGESVTFDFTGSDAQRPAPMNCNLTQTFTACVYVVKCLVDPDIPLNEGFYRPIRVIAPEGSVLNATHPTAIVGGWEVSMHVCEMLLKALSQALPDRVPAGSKGTLCQVGFGGKNPVTGEYYCFYETLAGGYGGRIGSDGPDAVQPHFQNTQNAPIEETELNYPVRIPRYSLISDSEGPGRTRGGLGLCREYTFVDHQPVFTTLVDRVNFRPSGLFGGEEGRGASCSVISNGKTIPIPSKGSIQLKPGDTIRVESPGGGGYGRPSERDAELMLRDVKEGKISAGRAKECYGVAIDTEHCLINREETHVRRTIIQGKSD